MYNSVHDTAQTGTEPMDDLEERMEEEFARARALRERAAARIPKKPDLFTQNRLAAAKRKHLKQEEQRFLADIEAMCDRVLGKSTDIG
jgi:hypothetical protein